MQVREQRYKVFEDCQVEIKSLLNNWGNSSPTVKYLKDNFGLMFVENSEVGRGYASFSIKWDDRTFDIDAEGNSLIEVGARIVIRQSVMGYVTITLYPAYTSISNQLEDFVILRHRLEPCWLCRKWVVWLLWRVFIDYSSMTSIDATPGFLSRVVVRLIRYTRMKCVKGIIMESNIWHDIKNMLALAFTLITSSLFVYYMQVNDTKKETVIQSSYYHKIDSIIVETTTNLDHRNDILDRKLDSIEAFHRQFSKEIKDLNNNIKYNNGFNRYKYSREQR